MKIHELDVVKLKDGREATVLEIFEQGEALLVEISDSKGQAIELPTVSVEDIETVTWSNK